MMALPYPLRPAILFLLLLLFIFESCKHGAKLYTSDCDAGKEFVHIGFKQLMDNLSDYDQQYVEVSGKYEEEKGVSALFCDSLFVDHSSNNALWVNFSQDCPLYLSGTHKGFFEYNDGKFIQINDKTITIRGMVDLHNKGRQKRYKATIDRISLVKI